MNNTGDAPPTCLSLTTNPLTHSLFWYENFSQQRRFFVVRSASSPAYKVSAMRICIAGEVFPEKWNSGKIRQRSVFCAFGCPEFSFCEK